MAYLQPGLYKVRQRSGPKLVVHVGIMDVGNRLRRPEGNYWETVVIHQCPPGIRIDSLDAFGPYEIVRPISDEAGAIRRIRLALRNPRYDPFWNNCEHFVSFVETGRRESGQLQEP